MTEEEQIAYALRMSMTDSAQAEEPAASNAPAESMDTDRKQFFFNRLANFDRKRGRASYRSRIPAFDHRDAPRSRSQLRCC